MDRETTRRALVSAIVAGGVGAGVLSPVRGYLTRFAPFSGDAWTAARRDPSEDVANPYGSATLRYDDEGVAHVEGSNEEALFFAAGYAQAADRLFQMDLQRRQMRGTLSAVVGEATLDSDRFHVAMDFAAAAEATWETARGTETGDVLEAYVEGVNRYVESEPLPLEFGLLGYEPDPWTPVDTFLMEKQISWGLTGSFRTLRNETARAALGEDVAATLYPDRIPHDAPIIRDDEGDFTVSALERPPRNGNSDRPARETHPDLLSWASTFESPPGVGSNSWVVSGAHTADGKPILANDPHLTLMAPPVWYEMNLQAEDLSVRGVTFPGVPFVIIGENRDGAWGFTNAGADVVDVYEYETREGSDGVEYRYGDEWRPFEEESRTVAVADGEDETVVVRKTVHGPVLDARADGDELRSEVAVAWTGFAATETVDAVRQMNHSTGVDEFRAALRSFDLPTQNCVYADGDGNTLYYVTGRVPIRQTDGEMVAGTRVFDGSAKEGEWPGYTPFDESSWEGFVPFEEKPHVTDPDVLGTANQRIVDDDRYPYYLAEAYATPFRGRRLYDLLDERVSGDDPVTPAFMRDVQRDVHDGRAELFVPTMLDVRSSAGEAVREELDRLADWDYRMTRDSRAALVFERFVHHYRRVAFEEFLRERLGEERDPEEFYPNDWVLLTLEDGPWFPSGRAVAIVEALEETRSELDAEGWQTYGDYNRTAIDHPFDRSWLNYPRYPTDGSPATLNNFRKESSVGSSWRQVCPMGESPSRAILPGGNDGDYFSDHYDDQLRRWADAEYRSLSLERRGDVAVEFGGGDGE